MKTIKKRFFLLIAGIILFNSCGDMTAKEILRVKMTRPGDLYPKHAYATMEKGDKIAIWSDMDFSYVGTSIQLEVQVELYLKDSLIETINLSPLDKSITLNEVTETEKSRTIRKFSGKNKEIEIRQDGNYKCIAYLKNTGSSFQVNKAEIVLKRKK